MIHQGNSTFTWKNTKETVEFVTLIMYNLKTLPDQIITSISILQRCSFTLTIKRLQRIFEAGAIYIYNSVNNRRWFYKISPFLSKSFLNRYSIFHFWLTFSIRIIISHIKILKNDLNLPVRFHIWICKFKKKIKF